MHVLGENALNMFKLKYKVDSNRGEEWKSLSIVTKTLLQECQIMASSFSKVYHSILEDK